MLINVEEVHLLNYEINVEKPTRKKILVKNVYKNNKYTYLFKKSRHFSIFCQHLDFFFFKLPIKIIVCEKFFSIFYLFNIFHNS